MLAYTLFLQLRGQKCDCFDVVLHFATRTRKVRGTHWFTAQYAKDLSR